MFNRNFWTSIFLLNAKFGVNALNCLLENSPKTNNKPFCISIEMFKIKFGYSIDLVSLENIICTVFCDNQMNKF